MGNNTVETIMGAIVVAVAAAFLYFAYTSTSAGSLGGYEVTAKMPRVDGLATGTDVRLSGIKIGAVSELTLDPKTYLVTLHMNIRNDIQIPDDSSLMVTSSGLLGGSYLSISPGGSDTMLKPGGQIANVQGSVDLMGLVGRFIGGGNNGGQQQQPRPQQPPQQPPRQPQPSAPNAHP
jgi:phospholipid/cholesterol/gamma-HCH transport system substrate-binding protein